MPPTRHRDPFVDWLEGHAVRLAHLDPEAPLDDLEPLRDFIGDARVVAVGENSHFIDEFSMLRRRILRFLAERCGFTVLAFEYGFSESFPLDGWARGEGTEDELTARVGTAIPVGVEDPLRWIRHHNRTASTPVRFAGIDIPAAGGSLLPALEPVAAYLREIDPETLPEAEAAIGIAATFAGRSAASAAPAWTRLTAADQDALSAKLLRLLTRFRAMEPMYVSRGGREGFDVAVRDIEAACAGDYTFRAMAGLFAGNGLTADTSARDDYMAGSVLWHLERSAPGTRMVLAAHNAHIQKTPVAFDGRLTGFPMGHYLHRTLGDEYFALGLTSVGGHTADMRPDVNARFGFTVDDTPLEPPETGSIEAAFADAEIGLGMVRLAPQVHGASHPDRIRIQSAYLHTPIPEAFDGILSTPTSTVTAFSEEEDPS